MLRFTYLLINARIIKIKESYRKGRLYGKILKEIFTIKGRINRKKFLGYWFLLFISSAISAALIQILPETIGLIVLIAIALTELIGQTCLVIRRFHDLERHGAMALLAFIPVISIVTMIYLFFVRGTSGYNFYGNDPLGQVEN